MFYFFYLNRSPINITKTLTWVNSGWLGMWVFIIFCYVFNYNKGVQLWSITPFMSLPRASLGLYPTILARCHSPCTAVGRINNIWVMTIITDLIIGAYGFLAGEKHVRVWDTWMMPLAAHFSPRDHLRISNITHSRPNKGERMSLTGQGLWTWSWARICGGSKTVLIT